MSKSLRDIELKIKKQHSEFLQRQKAKWSHLIPEIAYVLLKCGTTKRRAIVAGQVCDNQNKNGSRE